MLALLLAALCVVVNAFFVAAEFALAKVRPTALEGLARSGDAQAVRALAIMKRLDAYLPATQLGVTLASLGLGSVGEPAVASLLEQPLRAVGASHAMVHGVALGVAFATITASHIVLGELVPKSLALAKPETIARRSSAVLRAFYLASYPALVLLQGMSNLVLRVLGVPTGEREDETIPVDELPLVVRASLSAKDDVRKRELLERVLRSTDRAVRAIMVPRVDMATLSLDDDLPRVLSLVRRHGFSRYPLTEAGDPDHILGYVYVKDVLMHAPPAADGLRSLRRDALFIPESTTVGDLLDEFQRKKIPLAIVVDEYGGTAGMVTVEDIVEEIVGDLQDELDTEAPKITTREDGSVLVDGSVPVGEVELADLDLPPIEGGDTIGGYVVAALGRLARVGDRVRLGPWDAVVADVRKNRVNRVAFVRGMPRTMPPPAPLPAPTTPTDD